MRWTLGATKWRQFGTFLFDCWFLVELLFWTTAELVENDQKERWGMIVMSDRRYGTMGLQQEREIPLWTLQ